jgi:ubiquinone/menaquinone biosynthesis C-methylase UbiE
LHEKSPNSKTYGVDHSSTSVKKSRMMNRDEVEKGNIVIEEANVLDMPFENKTFDVITGFETVYFWPDIVNSFREVGRILKDEGIFFIILEANGCHNLDMEDQANDEGCTFYTDEELKKLLSDAGYSNLTFYLRNRQENTKLIRKITDDGCCEKIVEDKYDNDNYLEELESEDFKPSPQWMCIKAQK